MHFTSDKIIQLDWNQKNEREKQFNGRLFSFQFIGDKSFAK